MLNCTMKHKSGKARKESILWLPRRSTCRPYGANSVSRSSRRSKNTTNHRQRLRTASKVSCIICGNFEVFLVFIYSTDWLQYLAAVSIALSLIMTNVTSIHPCLSSAVIDLVINNGTIQQEYTGNTPTFISYTIIICNSKPPRSSLGNHNLIIWMTKRSNYELEVSVIQSLGKKNDQICGILFKTTRDFKAQKLFLLFLRPYAK